NWAAWPVVGPLGDHLAGLLSGTEITGDGPSWIQRELDAQEPPVPAHLPYLVLRKATLFPGRVRVMPFGRPASVAAVERMIERKQPHLAILIQRDTWQEDFPQRLEEVLPVGIYSRIVRAEREDDAYQLILKGIERLIVRTLAAEVAGVEPAR